MGVMAQPSKGERKPVHFRVPTEHREIYEHLADESGLDLGDYLALVLATAHELDVPAYINRTRTQKELPLGA